VNLMAKVPPKVQQSVAAALAIIAQRDFPGEWDGLLPDLVARLASPDLHMVTGVLETANSIFERCVPPLPQSSWCHGLSSLCHGLSDVHEAVDHSLPGLV